MGMLTLYLRLGLFIRCLDLAPSQVISSDVLLLERIFVSGAGRRNAPSRTAFAITLGICYWGVFANGAEQAPQLNTTRHAWASRQ